MVENEEIDFDPIALRARLAQRNEHFAACLATPLYADEAWAVMPGLMEWHTYRAIPPEEQDPPGLTAADFARAYRNVPHPGGILSKRRGE